MPAVRTTRGFDLHLTKPIDPAALASVLTTLAGGGTSGLAGTGLAASKTRARVL